MSPGTGFARSSSFTSLRQTPVTPGLVTGGRSSGGEPAVAPVRRSRVFCKAKSRRRAGTARGTWAAQSARLRRTHQPG